eukprot:2473077-Rhodomonas_salina.2
MKAQAVRLRALPRHSFPHRSTDVRDSENLKEDCQQTCATTERRIQGGCGLTEVEDGPCSRPLTSSLLRYCRNDPSKSHRIVWREIVGDARHKLKAAPASGCC